MAILAIAFHTMLWSFGAAVAADPADPFSVICHGNGGTSVQDDGSSGTPASKPSAACDHCSLCSATPAPAVLDSLRLDRSGLTATLARLTPATAAIGHGIADSPKLAQGPPQSM